MGSAHWARAQKPLSQALEGQYLACRGMQHLQSVLLRL